MPARNNKPKAGAKGGKNNAKNAKGGNNRDTKGKKDDRKTAKDKRATAKSGRGSGKRDTRRDSTSSSGSASSSGSGSSSGSSSSGAGGRGSKGKGKNKCMDPSTWTYSEDGVCMTSGCDNKLGMTFRHHCRDCGIEICGECYEYEAKIGAKWGPICSRHQKSYTKKTVRDRQNNGLVLPWLADLFPSGGRAPPAKKSKRDKSESRAPPGQKDDQFRLGKKQLEKGGFPVLKKPKDKDLFHYWLDKGLCVGDICEKWSLILKRAGYTPKAGREQRADMCYGHVRTHFFSLVDSADTGIFTDLDARRLRYKKESLMAQRVLIVGAGPAGLRMAIEAALIGCACVTVVEAKTGFTRNNVLRLWPFVTKDLRSLGVHRFIPNFGNGSSVSVNAWKLQVALMKIGMLLGVHFRFNADITDGWEKPCKQSNGWYTLRGDAKNQFGVPMHTFTTPVYFNVCIGADGENSFVAKQEKLKMSQVKNGPALVVVANIERDSKQRDTDGAELAIDASFQKKWFDAFHKQFDELKLDHLLYHRDETHFLCFSVHKAGLVKHKVLKKDHKDNAKVLDSANVNMDKLASLVYKIAQYVKIPKGLKLVKIANSKSLDLHIVDFTKRHEAERPISIIVRRKASEVENRKNAGKSGKNDKKNDKKNDRKKDDKKKDDKKKDDKRNTKQDEPLRGMFALVGDALAAPYWPSGTGVNRAVLSSLDTAWAMRNFARAEMDEHTYTVRQNAYKNMMSSSASYPKDREAFTFDPVRRYKTGWGRFTSLLF